MRFGRQSNPCSGNSIAGCSSKPSQKHPAQETGTYDAEVQQPVVRPSRLISSAHWDILAKSTRRVWQLELASDETNKRAFLDSGICPMSSATETPSAIAFAIVRNAQVIETTPAVVPAQSMMRYSMLCSPNCCVSYYVWVSRNVFAVRDISRAGWFSSRRFASRKDKLLWRNVRSTMLMQCEPLFFIDFLVTGEDNHYVISMSGGIENGDNCPFPERSERIQYNAKNCKWRTARNSVVCRKQEKRLIRMKRRMNCDRKSIGCSTSSRESLTILVQEPG